MVIFNSYVSHYQRVDLFHRIQFCYACPCCEIPSWDVAKRSFFAPRTHWLVKSCRQATNCRSRSYPPNVCTHMYIYIYIIIFIIIHIYYIIIYNIYTHISSNCEWPMARFLPFPNISSIQDASQRLQNAAQAWPSGHPE